MGETIFHFRLPLPYLAYTVSTMITLTNHSQDKSPEIIRSFFTRYRIKDLTFLIDHMKIQLLLISRNQ